MLLIRLKDEKEEVVFLNGDFRETQMQYEMGLYLAKKERHEADVEVLLAQAETLKYKLIVDIKVPTILTAESAFADEKRELLKGDKVIIHSNATYEIKRTLWNRIRFFFQ